MEWKPPAETATALPVVLAMMGIGLSTVVPSPSSPKSLVPQAHTAPSLVIASTWLSLPFESAFTPARPMACTGVQLSTPVSLLPRTPLVFAPQQYTVLSAQRKQVLYWPAETCACAALPERMTVESRRVERMLMAVGFLAVVCTVSLHVRLPTVAAKVGDARVALECPCYRGSPTRWLFTSRPSARVCRAAHRTCARCLARRRMRRRAAR